MSREILGGGGSRPYGNPGPPTPAGQFSVGGVLENINANLLSGIENLVDAIENIIGVGRDPRAAAETKASAVTLITRAIDIQERLLDLNQRLDRVVSNL